MICGGVYEREKKIVETQDVYIETKDTQAKMYYSMEKDLTPYKVRGGCFI